MAWNEPGPGRDPWNSPGGKRSDGPSELDALMRRLRQWWRASGMPGGGPSGVVSVGVSALLAVWLISGFYTVDEQERAVVLRFGAYAGTVGPGVKWHLPWPVERVEKVTMTGVRSVQERAQILTQDQNLVDVEVNVQYRVSSAEDYLFNVQDSRALLQQVTASATRDVVGAVGLDAVLTEGRQGLADHIAHAMQRRLDGYHAGLVVTGVNLQQVQPPEAVQAAFADAIKAREEQQRLHGEAEAYAAERLPRARNDAARQLANAQAYRDEAVARAEGDTARFTALLNEYRRAPQVTRDRMYLDTMDAVLGKAGKVVLDIDKGNPNIVLPLADLGLEHAAVGEAPAATHAAAPSARGNGSANAAPSDSERDSYRSRDRGEH